MVDKQQARRRLSIDTSALFKAALLRISTATVSHIPHGALTDEEADAETAAIGEATLYFHSSVDGQVHECQSLINSTQASQAPCSESSAASGHDTLSTMEVEPSLLPPVTCGQVASFPPSFPSYKRIPGTHFIVDGFRHAGPWSRSYFLSHFHSDHYTGLTPAWDRGIIFCSHITARLVLDCIKVPVHLVFPLPMGEPVEIDTCFVTLVDANHCPGAVQFLFQVPAEKSGVFSRYVHTGDMRYSSDMKADPSLCDFVGADAVFLDTTYCNPKYIFPSQSESIGYIADTIFTLREDGNDKLEGLTHVYDDSEEMDEVLIQEAKLPQEVVSAVDAPKADSEGLRILPNGDLGSDIEEDSKLDDAKTNVQNPELQGRGCGSTLFLISTYVIGKERILLAVAKRCNCLIYVNEKKLSILKCLELENLDVFSTSPSATNVHVVSWNFLGETWPFFRPNFRKMEELLRKSGCDRVVGFVPTGWTYETKKKTFSVRRKGPLEIHLVPYSEHSNYDELREYVAFLRPHEILPTVGLEGGDMGSKAVAAMRKHFRNLVDETASKRRFLKSFSRKNGIESKTIQGRRPEILNMRMESHKAKPLSGISEACASKNMPDLPTGFEELPSMDTKEFPKVAFGRRAKKRQRESHERGKFEESVPVLMTEEKALGEGESLPALCHIPSDELGVKEDTGSASVSKEKRDQLRNVLSSDINEKQLDNLLFEANGDLDLAVALYFEGSMNGQHGQASMKDDKHASTGASDVALSVTLGANTKTQSEVKEKSISTTREYVTRKTTSSMAASAIKRRRGSQASILTFFKKSTSSATCTTVAENNSSWQTDPANSKITEFDHENKETVVSKSPNTVPGLDQLVAVLGDSVALDKAQTLLEESRGDVGAALDMYYRSRNIEEGDSKTTLSKCKDSTVVIEIKQTGAGTGQQRSEQFDKEPVCKVAGIEAKNDFVAMSIWEYKPVDFACWKSGEAAPYLHLARTFDLVEQESGRLRTSDMLCNMFRSLLALSSDAVLPAIYLSINRIAPDYENVDLNIGGSTVSAAIVEATGTQKSKIKEMYSTMGDLGDVAQACRQTQSLLVAPRMLSIQQVFSTLLQISKETGSGSSSRKKSLILGLLRACREKEMKYIVRTLVQNMRIGAMMRSVLPALAQAIVLHTSNTNGEQLKDELLKASSGIMDAYNFMPNLNILVPALLQDGIQTVLSNVAVSPGIPVKPMLAKIMTGIPEVFKRFQGKPFTCEYKYDGQRAQVHLMENGMVKVFSRNCEDTTSRFPDVLDIVRMAVKPGIQDLIFDAEIVAVDRGNNNKLMAFQHLSTRERGRNGAIVSIENIKVDVCLFVFDLMYANGTPLVKMAFSERRNRMKECFLDLQAGRFGFANQIMIEGKEASVENSAAVTRVESFLEEAINSSCEGIMVKALNEESAYAPSKRSDSWLKVKRDYIEGLHDTLDLVPIGAWHGNGRKAGWFSPFLLACYDAEREEYQSVCRVMSGFTDAFYKQMKAFFCDERVLERKPTYYQTLEEPDIWFSPELVWEIRGADLTVSPVHQAAVGLVHPSRGISLRFPRFIKERPDKKPEDASAPGDIADLFQQQSRKLEIPAQ